MTLETPFSPGLSDTTQCQLQVYSVIQVYSVKAKPGNQTSLILDFGRKPHTPICARSICRLSPKSSDIMYEATSLNLAFDTNLCQSGLAIYQRRDRRKRDHLHEQASSA